MENKLKMELDALPGPVTAFEDMEGRQAKPKSLRLRKKTVVILAAVLALLLCGMGWARTNLRYGMWHIYGSGSWNDIEWIMKKYDIVLPGTMDGVPFDDFNTYGHTPQGAPRIQAFLNPAYRPYILNYALWDSVETTFPDGTHTTYTYTTEDFSLHFGTWENELWRYYFQFDGNDCWTGCDVPESYCTMEYRGITLQIGDTTYYNDMEGRDVYTRWVHWVDENKKIVFALSEGDYSDPSRVVECAKMIIDLNNS